MKYSFIKTMNMKKAFLIVACFLAVGGVSSYAQDVGIEPTVILADDVYAKPFVAELTQKYVLVAPVVEIAIIQVDGDASTEMCLNKAPEALVKKSKNSIEFAADDGWRIRMRSEVPLKIFDSKPKADNPNKTNYFRSMLR